VHQIRKSTASLVVLPILATVAATMSFQLGAALAKGLFPLAGTFGTATLRLCLGAALLVAVARPWRTWPRQAPILPLLGLGLSMAGVISLFFLAMERLPLGVAIALQFLGPLGIALLGSRRPSDLLWAGLAAAGVWSLVGIGSTAISPDPIGVVFGLAAAGCWASYILCGRAAGASFGTSTAAISVSIAALIVLPVGVHQAGASLLTLVFVPTTLLMALLSTVIPFSLELYALPRLPARTFAVLTSTEPAFGVLFGLLVLNERLAITQIAGVAAVMIAAAGAAWSSADEKKRASGSGGAQPPPT
jgi:inner membrane transporter RhtA